MRRYYMYETFKVTNKMNSYGTFAPKEKSPNSEESYC